MNRKEYLKCQETNHDNNNNMNINRFGYLHRKFEQAESQRFYFILKSVK